MSIDANPKSPDEYGMNSDEYRAMYRVESTHWWYGALRDLFFYWVGRLKPRTLLDAGCGTGITLLQLQKRGLSAHGIDASELAIRFCEERGAVNLKKAIVQQLPFEGEQFDCIFSLDVLSELPTAEESRALGEFHRCLKPGGALILNLPALQFLFSQHDVACRHLRRYDRRETVALMERHGFEIVRATYRVSFLFPLLAASKLLRRAEVSNRPSEEVKGDLERTSPLINLLLAPVMALENRLLRSADLPIGTSLFVVARKKAG